MKHRWGKVIENALTQASAKGLSVAKNSVKEGWSITLPGGGTYHAVSNADLVKYVRGY